MVWQDLFDPVGAIFTLDAGHDLRTKSDVHLGPCPHKIRCFPHRYLPFNRLALGRAYALPFAATDESFPQVFRCQIFATAGQSAFGSNQKPADLPLTFSYAASY